MLEHWRKCVIVCILGQKWENCVRCNFLWQLHQRTVLLRHNTNISHLFYSVRPQSCETFNPKVWLPCFNWSYCLGSNPLLFLRTITISAVSLSTWRYSYFMSYYSRAAGRHKQFPNFKFLISWRIALSLPESIRKNVYSSKILIYHCHSPFFEASSGFQEHFLSKILRILWFLLYTKISKTERVLPAWDKETAMQSSLAVSVII